MVDEVVTPDAAPAAEVTPDVTPAAVPANDNTDAEPKAESTLLSNEPAVAEKIIPEAYESFTMPEGMEFNEAILNDFNALAKDLNLSQEEAQKVVDIGNKNMTEVLQGQADAWTEVRQGWVQSLKEDTEFGGAKFDETLTRARRSLSKFGDEKLNSMLEQTGYGDNPDLVRLLARIDKAIGETPSVGGSPAGATTKTHAEVIYGS